MTLVVFKQFSFDHDFPRDRKSVYFHESTIPLPTCSVPLRLSSCFVLLFFLEFVIQYSIGLVGWISDFYIRIR